MKSTYQKRPQVQNSLAPPGGLVHQLWKQTLNNWTLLCRMTKKQLPCKTNQLATQEPNEEHGCYSKSEHGQQSSKPWPVPSQGKLQSAQTPSKFLSEFVGTILGDKTGKSWSGDT